MSQIAIRDAVKVYGDYKAVNCVNLRIEEGELFTLLGPSGCGKTTLLRMIAGFNSIDQGEIYLGDQLINTIPAHKRNIGMVFQNYAIFPHMSVFQNVAYGLKARKIPKSEIENRVVEALAMVQMEEFRDRSPSQLSGGQQQRVALARAIVIHPDVLLMDEPLSNLDAKLRLQMRSIIRKLQKELQITTIYVTHDQEEALAISDRIAVMKLGEVQQVGTPEEIYKHPKNTFIGNFIGTSNFLDGVVQESDHRATKQSADTQQSVDLEKEEVTPPTLTLTSVLVETKVLQFSTRHNPEGKIIIALRPEEIRITDFREGEIEGEVVVSTFLGDFTNYEIALPSGKIIEVNEYTKDVDRLRKVGERVSITLMTEKAHLYDPTGEITL